MAYEREQLRADLRELQDLKYRDFHSNLIPGIDKEDIIGIRMPVLRKFAGNFAKTEDAKAFLKDIPHRYYEENNLHMMLLGKIREFDRCLQETIDFLPFVNNWATCDFPAPKCFAKNKEKLLPYIEKWLDSGKTYTIRYGIGMLMRLYLDEDFDSRYPEMVAKIQSEKYYVEMMIAWYFATALAKQWDDVIGYLEQEKLSDSVHRKTIQKAVESYRITDEQKIYLRSLRK